MKLTEAQLSTLNEMTRYTVYPWRQATCKSLVALGLAEPCYEWRPGKPLKRPPHRITPAGRAALKEQTP